jgi:hypothetical protein
MTNTARSERCHPEPQAKDLAAAFFAAVICLLWGLLRTVHRRPAANSQSKSRGAQRAARDPSLRSELVIFLEIRIRNYYL